MQGDFFYAGTAVFFFVQPGVRFQVMLNFRHDAVVRTSEVNVACIRQNAYHTHEGSRRRVSSLQLVEERGKNKKGP